MSLARARRFMGDVFVVAVGVCRIGCEVARERPTASCCGFCSLLLFVLLLCVRHHLLTQCNLPIPPL